MNNHLLYEQECLWFLHRSYSVQNTGLVSESYTVLQLIVHSLSNQICRDEPTQELKRVLSVFPRAIFEIPRSDIAADDCVPYMRTSTGKLNICFKVSVKYMPYNKQCGTVKHNTGM
jgi:hypothetical protein